MIMGDKNLHLLVVEDNPGDFLLIQEYIAKEFFDTKIYHARSYCDTKRILKDDIQVDAILLDLTLADKSGVDLVKGVLMLAGAVPVLVLTGNEDKAFGIKTLSWGVSDYLLKEELNSSHLYKAILYSIERKKNLKDLEESKEKYKRIFSFSPLPMWIVDSKTLFFIDVNEAAIRSYGYSRDEFLSMNIQEIRPREDLEIFKEKIKKVESGGFFQDIFRHTKKSGETIIVEIQSNEIILEGRKARLVLGNDVTKRYTAEEQLRFSEQRFKALVQEGSDMVAILSLDGVYQYVSPTSTAILGTPPEHYISRSVFDFIHRSDHDRIKQYLTLLSTQKRVSISPFRFKDALGNWRWIETILTNMVDDPAINGVVANSRDITQSVEYELKLRESVARYNIVAKATSDTIWDWDLKSNKILWNKGIKDVFGYEESEICEDASWWSERIHPADSRKIMAKLDEQLKKKLLNWREEYRFLCADGNYKYVLDKGFLVLDKHNNPVRMLGAMQDISRKKEEEEHLKLLESVITHAKDAVVITKAEQLDDPGPQIMYVNRAFEEMTGYSIDEIVGKSPRFLQGPNSSRTELAFLRKKMEKGESCSIEVINYRKSGEEYWVKIEVAPVKDNSSHVTHFIAIQRDVTEQKNYILAIERQNLKLREIGWMQSHIVRAPLARILGLIDYLGLQAEKEPIDLDLLNNICISANELDHLLREIVKKSEKVKINSKDETKSTDN